MLLVGATPADPVPDNLLAVEISRGQPAYLAGALAALTGAHTVAVVGGDDELAAAVRAGGEAAGTALEVATAACGASTSADVIYVERAECLSGDETGKVVAPELVDGADQLAVVGPRPWVAVAAAARAVQAGRWVPGVMLEGLRQDVLGNRLDRPLGARRRGRSAPADRGSDPRRAGGRSGRRARPVGRVD